MFVHICSVYLNSFWQVSVPQETLGADGSSRDPSCPVPVADKVYDWAKVDDCSAADTTSAGTLRQVHPAGGQRHICPLEASTLHRRPQENRDSEEPVLTGLAAEPPPHLHCLC